MLHAIDTSLFLLLNRAAANPVLDWFMPRITSLHHHRWFVVVAAVVVVAVLIRGSRRAKAIVLCAIAAVTLGDVAAAKGIKRLVPRDRPCHTAGAPPGLQVPEARVLGDCPGSKSFPSNHAANTMAVAAVAWSFTRTRGRWLWFLLPLVIGYSRVYLGYHYPLDLVGGWALGAVAASVCVRVARALGGGSPPPQPERA